MSFEKELISAVKQNDLNAITTLSRKVRNYEAKDDEGTSLLMLAAHHGNLLLFKWLFLQRMDARGHLSIFNIQACINPYNINFVADAFFFEKIFSLIEVNKHQPVTKYLIEQRKLLLEEKNYYGMTSLSFAVLNKKEFLVGWLLSQGADIYVINSKGETILDMARRINHPRICDMFNNIVDMHILLNKLKRAPHALKLISYEDIKIHERVAKWCFGAIYKGEYQFASVAVKKMRSKKLTLETIEEITAEALIMSKMRSPYIAQFYGVCIQLPHCGIVMEYLPNGNLFQSLKENVLIDLKKRSQIALDIIYGLFYLHDEEIIHGDLKSSNVMLDKDLRGKLIDFGGSFFVKDKKPAEEKFYGTPRWMAPALYDKSRKAKPNKFTDMYSYGVILLELETGKCPLENVADEFVATHTIVGQRDEIPTTTNPLMAALIAKCWDLRAENRPHTLKAAEVVLQVHQHNVTRP